MNLSIEYCPKHPTKMEDMTKVPYVIFVGSLMYAMFCTSLEIVVGVLGLWKIMEDHIGMLSKDYSNI
jgi:hypothetical protein